MDIRRTSPAPRKKPAALPKTGAAVTAVAAKARINPRREIILLFIKDLPVRVKLTALFFYAPIFIGLLCHKMNLCPRNSFGSGGFLLIFFKPVTVLLSEDVLDKGNSSDM